MQAETLLGRELLSQGPQKSVRASQDPHVLVQRFGYASPEQAYPRFARGQLAGGREQTEMLQFRQCWETWNQPSPQASGHDKRKARPYKWGPYSSVKLFQTCPSTA